MFTEYYMSVQFICHIRYEIKDTLVESSREEKHVFPFMNYRDNGNGLGCVRPVAIACPRTHGLMYIRVYQCVYKIMILLYIIHI